MLIKKELTVEDVESSEMIVIKYVQKHEYQKEIFRIGNNLPLKKSSSIYKLDPVVDVNGILRVGSRLKQAQVSADVSHPVILPKNHHVSKLLMMKSHESSGHSGNEYSISKLRTKFWVPGARTVMRKLIKECTWCNKYRRSLCTQRMADLPRERITPDTPAFTNVGLDCFGPIAVRRGRTTEKRYGCLFTCFSTRAVHLEKLHSLDSSSFINALSRFMSRRGVPAKIRSDNGTNFTGAVREMKTALNEIQNSKKVRDNLLMNRITWIFNPPYASHMGGIWERCIRTVRKVLNIIVHKQVLDDERLDTFLCEVESILNNRPLTYCSIDVNDSEPLTPNHLLLLRPGNNTIMTNTSNVDQYNRRWKNVQFLADKFWKSWTRQYIPLIQIRSKWHKFQPNIKVGDLVMIAENNFARNQWPMARIVEVYHGRDGLVRSVKLRTSTSELVRPITKLCLLEGVFQEN